MSHSEVSIRKTTLQVALENKRVVVCCMYACLGTLTYSFSVSLLLSFPQFRKQFGHEYQGGYVVPAEYQSVWNGLLVPGGVLGALLSGPIGNRLGRRYLFVIGSVVFAAGVLGQNLARNWKIMAVGKFINYAGMAMYSVATPTYISEIAPPEIRGVMLAMMGSIMLVGKFVTACILKGTQNLSGNLSFHVPIILQYIIPFILFTCTWIIPESPFWLVGRGKIDAAKASLKMLHGGKPDLDQRLQDIQDATNEQQKASNVTYLDCFKGSNRRRTFIAAGILFSQEFIGVTFIFQYTTYFFILAGVKQSEAFSFTAIMFALQLVANMLSWYLIERFGRRFLLLTGTTVVLISHFVIGGIGTSSTYTSGPFPKAVVSFMVILTVFYELSLGSAGWAVSGEASTPALRALTQSIAVMASTISAFVIFFTIPYLINPDEANLGPKIYFIYGSFTILVLAFIYFMVPEMKGRKYEELDYMFQHRIPTRKFKGFSMPTGEVTRESSNDEKSPQIKEVSL